MLAAVRPDSWNLPLFVHVLGAMALFGGTLAVATFGWAASRRPQRELLVRAAFRTLLAVVLPGWIVMRIGAEWTQSKEDISGTPDWIGVGMAVADPGLILILVTVGLAYWAARRRGIGWQPRAVAALTSLYLVALAVAWWVMSTKP
jgi:hypothetical protein